MSDCLRSLSSSLSSFAAATLRGSLSMSCGLLVASAAMTLAGCSSSDDPGVPVSSVEGELASHDVVSAGATLRVTASSLNVRSGPSASATILSVVSANDILTCAETSGENGWVHIRTADGVDGWVFGKYVTIETSGSGSSAGSPSTPTSGSSALGTCAPGRADGVLSRYEKALHDAIAFAEGTRGDGEDGYNVMFSSRKFSSCQSHPDQCIAFGSSCSTAAGRYQFLTTTWNGIASARSLSTFEPENQERGAAYLVGTVRRVDVPQDRALTASEFSNAMSKLSYEWASLPPGRYGQPTKTLSQLRTFYCSLAGC